MDSKKGGSHTLLPPPTANLAAKRRQHLAPKFVLLILCSVALITWKWFPAHNSRGYHIEDSHEGFRQLSKLLDLPHSAASTEETFLAVPDTGRATNTSHWLARHPHLAGSPNDFQNAKDILRFIQKEWGLPPASNDEDLPVYSAGSEESRHATLSTTEEDGKINAWIDTYYPLLNTGTEQALQILNSDGFAAWEASLLEVGDPTDEAAEKYKYAIPTWHVLSADGDVSGQLIYANYGFQEDYDALIEGGANLTGKIVLTRYGGNFRGLKVQRAAELGAAGVLIYSDLRDDGHVTAENGYEAYPLGPARNLDSVQRGSVTLLSIYPGDPYTPGTPAYENATRQEPYNTAKIPSLPISWNNAARLLEELGGIDEGRKLNGKVSEREIRLVNRVDNHIAPMWNIMGTIPGVIKDEVVVIGCHHDAWVMGGADPVSGTTSLLEIVAGFGKLLRSGWKPARTIVIGNWDGEESGLFGSTEWGEDFADWISEHVVAYLNVDVSAVGSAWFSSASPLLSHLIIGTAKDLPHPTDPSRTLWDAKDDVGPFKAGTADINSIGYTKYSVDNTKSSDAGVVDAPVPLLPPLGSGSDFSVFIQRLGIASSNLGFKSSSSDAIYHYHSIYDTVRWQELYADPGFHRHVTVAKHLGLLALRLADSFLLPLNTTQYAIELEAYLNKVEALGHPSDPVVFNDLRASIKSLQAASIKLDIEKEEAIAEFYKSAHHSGHHCGHGLFQDRFRNAIRSVLPFSRGTNSIMYTHELEEAAKRIHHVNKKLASFEKGFLSEEGLPGREWFKHFVVAPGKYLGYGATTLPALTEAITISRNISLAYSEAARLQVLFDTLAEKLVL